MFRSIDGTRDGIAPMTPTPPDHLVYRDLGSINTVVREATAAQLTPKKDISAMTPEEIDAQLPSLPLVAEGKTKSLYEHPNKSGVVLMKSRDSITGGDGAVKAEMPGKGVISTSVTQHIYKRLAEKGVRTHLVGQVSPTVLEVKKAAKHLPGEFIFRNYSWGSFAKKQGNKGAPLDPPVFEVFYKNDVFDTGGNKISDPEVRQDADGTFAKHGDGRPVLVKPGTDEIIEYTFENVKTPSGQVVDREIFLADIDLMEKKGQEIKEMTLRVGAEIKTFFEECGMTSIDGKIEFGLDEQGQLMLIDVFDFDSGRQGINAQFEKKLVAIDQVDKDKFRARGKEPAKRGLPITPEEADELVMNDYRLGMRLIENREKFEHIEAMLASGNCLWRSTELETAKSGDGKMNILVKENGKIVMYVCKPGCFERIEVTEENGQKMTLADTELQGISIDTESWPDITEKKWSPAGSTADTPGAVFSVVREKKFGKITLRWTLEHTNPTEPNGSFTVKDTIVVVTK